METQQIETIADVIVTLAAIPKAKVLLVGGAVRDFYLGNKTNEVPDSLPALLKVSKDLDIEVYGVQPSDLLAALNKYPLDIVGKQFGVIKLKGIPIDISLPRRESSHGVGHKDFNIVVDPNLTTKEAAERRDFTINSMAIKLESSCDSDEIILVDHFNGIADIRSKILRATSNKFAEDPLRPLRAMQFIARFDLTPTHCLVKTCKAMKESVRLLPKERIQEEFNKLLLKGKRIDKGLQFLVDTELIDLFPELKDIIDVPQHPDWHPEGDVWNHTLHCLQAYVEIRELVKNEKDRLALGYSVLGHDLGKAPTTRGVNRRIKAHGHEQASAPLVRSFMERMFDPANDIIGLVEKLVAAHMRPVQVFDSGCSIPALRRISLAVDGRLDLLINLVTCDQKGRPPLPCRMEATDWVNRILATHGMKPNERPQGIIKGRHILALTNLKPGPQIGAIIAEAFEAQLDGKFVDEVSGIEYVKSHILK